MPAAESAAEFLALAADYQLGALDTEGFHPLTARLSEQARDDLPAALRALQAVDAAALEKLCGYAPGVTELAAAVAATFAADRRVFLSGCGATGRLALACEWLGRADLLPPALAGRVTGFMAGGDAALIRSIENFEDFPEYGARQLVELGFADGDLLIAATEGGETPWVIGTAERAAALSRRAPWFLYCNPDAQLRAAVERSRRVLDDPRIRKLGLSTGPMALAGSTRMQASTVLMAAIALALQHHAAPAVIGGELRALADFVRTADYPALAPLTAAEAELYVHSGRTLYRTRTAGLTVLTDTTERAPTFSLAGFENVFAAGQPSSLAYLHLPGAPAAAAAWRALLLRAPRTLEWPGLEKLTHRAWLDGYDFSDRAPARPPRREPVGVELAADAAHFALREISVTLPAPPGDLLGAHLFLKMLLNAHSTAVMARLGRSRGNVMTYVRPSNLKLIDRAARYARRLWRDETGEDLAYDTVIHALFAVRPTLGPDEPAVLRIVEYLHGAGRKST